MHSNTKPHTQSKPPPANPLLPLTVTALTYTANQTRLIDQLSLALNSRGITVILGPNGAGKSLLLRLLHGLLTAAAGSIEWGQQPIDAAIRAQQSLVFQKPVLLRRTVRANIEFVLKLRRRDTADCDARLAAVRLQRQAHQPARSLSGGEQQRLALARALATQPWVLMLDEATANLDPTSTSIIEHILQQQKTAGVKVIVVTHDLGQARRLADDVVFMQRGRLVENTPAARFFQQPDTAAAAAFLAGQLVF